MQNRTWLAGLLNHDASLALAKSEFRHYAQRRGVVLEGLRFNGAQAQLGKSELHHGGGGFSSVALPPVRPGKHVVDFPDAVHNIDFAKTAGANKGLIKSTHQTPFVVAALSITNQGTRNKMARVSKTLMPRPSNQAADFRVAGKGEN